MPTTFIFRPVTGTITSTGARYLAQRAAATDVSIVTTTVDNGTNIQVTDAGTALTWYSEPITTQVTISGSVSVVIRGFQSSSNVNATAGILIQRGDNAGAVLSTIVPDSVVNVSEYLTTQSDRTGTFTPTSTTMNVGERIIAVMKVRNAGTMGAGTVTNIISGAPLRSYMIFSEEIVTDEILNTPIYTVFGSNGYKG